MRKELSKVELIKGTAQRGSHKGQGYEYIRATLKATSSNWLANNKTREDYLFIMNNDLVAIFKDFIAKKNGGNLESEENAVLPDQYRFINNVFRVRVPLNAKYVRVYEQDQKDAQGRVLHKKGEVYKTELGSVMVYDALEVLAVKVEDEDTGEMYWVDSPERIAQRILARNYRLLEPANEPGNSGGDAADDEPGSAEAPKTAAEKSLDEMSPEELKAKLAAMNEAK